ncbi:MAG: hypothetical protein NVSMB9_03610 [Isosphaeraceae bacterium]
MNDRNAGTAGLSAQDKRALLARLIREKTRNTDPLDYPVHRLFETQARRSPSAVAVAYEGAVLTYEELNSRANRMGRHLRSLGVGPEVMVGLCVNRGINMVVGLLGILKAGGAYVPVDPGFPKPRISFMLEDSRVPVLIVEDSTRERFDTGEALLVNLPGKGEDWEGLSDENLPSNDSSLQLAYVIYTSGSTGIPKGVMITHRALTNFLYSMRRQPGLDEHDRLLAVTTLSFDIAALELFLPLIVGARVEIVSREVTGEGARLVDTLASTGATVMQATSASWRLLLDSDWEGNPNLTVLCGGEALTRELAERLTEKCKTVWNLYGPTETTIWSTLTQVEAGLGAVPIGRPIANTRAYVLDAHLRPLPVGVAGEFYLGGIGLARGYLDRPGLTADRFLPDPFSTEPGSRLFRTGDLARYRPDGVIECLGRQDGQVKIRGYRVELGEVESALSTHPAVGHAVAVAREDLTGEKRLIAYFVPRADVPSPNELRSWLLDRLPDYMVPSIIVPLDALPLTPNGKVDRNALPDPVKPGGTLTGSTLPPRGPVEEALVTIWSEVLERETPGIHDNFFEIGGHSLLAARLLARVRDTFSVDLPLKALFDSPTVAGLGSLVEEALRSGAGFEIPPLEPVPRDGPLPASFAQQRLWFLDQLEPASSAYNIPAAVRLKGTLNHAVLEQAFQELVRRHESLRTTFTSEDGLPLQVIAPTISVEVPIEDLTAFPQADRETEALRRSIEEAWMPFDLSRGALFRTRLYRLDLEDHLITVVMHHVVSDGWSIGVLIYEMGVLYDAFSRGDSSPLPELVIQYADFTVWQRQWLKGETLENQLGFWRNALSKVPVLELPTDHPRPASPSRRGAQRFHDFPDTLSDSLRDLGREEGVTLFMTMLAGFQILLHRYSGQHDFAVGTPIAGRTWSRTEGLIGFFANTLALRADLTGEPSFRELLARVKRATLEGYAHQDLPFDQVVNALHPERDPSRAPLFQVMLVFQNAPLPALKTADLVMTPLVVESVTAKFDLTLAILEMDGTLKTALEYNTDLFEATTMDRLLRHLQTLLESAVHEPDRSVATLAMLTEEEQRLMLGWNQADRENENDSSRISGCEESLAELSSLSDDELDALINQL